MFTKDSGNTSEKLAAFFPQPIFVLCQAANVKLLGGAAKEDSHIRCVMMLAGSIFRLCGQICCFLEWANLFDALKDCLCSQYDLWMSDYTSVRAGRPGAGRDLRRTFAL